MQLLVACTAVICHGNSVVRTAAIVYTKAYSTHNLDCTTMASVELYTYPQRHGRRYQLDEEPKDRYPQACLPVTQLQPPRDCICVLYSSWRYML